MPIHDPRLMVLMDKVWKLLEQAQDDERATLQVIDGLQEVFKVNTIDLLEEAGYIQKSEPKVDPVPGPMRKLPLVDALARISVHIVERSDVRGLRLQCLRCGLQWDVDSYEGGNLNRPAGKLWMRCPAGCNMSAQFLWDQNEPPSFNPLSEYKQP